MLGRTTNGAGRTSMVFGVRKLFRRKREPVPRTTETPLPMPSPKVSGAFDGAFPAGPEAYGSLGVAEQASVTDLAIQVAERTSQTIDALPPFPELAARVSQILRQDDPDMRELLRAVGADPAVAADVIRTANTAYYRRAGEVTTLRDAVVRVGPKATCKIALASCTRELFDLRLRAGQARFYHIQQRLWHHAMTTAFGASALAFRYRTGSVQRTFLGGMLHDFGKNAVLQTLCAMVGSGELERDVRDRVVQAILHDTHAELAEELAKRWELPSAVQSICALHHREATPENSRSSQDESCVDDAHWVRVGSCIDSLLHLDGYREQTHAELNYSLRALGIEPRDYVSLVDKVRDMSNRVFELLSMPASRRSSN